MDVILFFTRKFKANDKSNEIIAQNVKVMAQSFRRILSVSFSCNFKTKPVRSPLNPVGKKTIKVPFVSSRIARIKPMINHTFPEYSRVSIIIFNFFICNAVKK